MTPAEILSAARTIAVVGMSRSPRKEAQRIPALLAARGWTIVPVNPHAREILGLRAYPTLREAPPADLVLVFRPSDLAGEIVAEALDVGASAVWLQAGITSAEGRRLAEQAGAAYVEDACAGVIATVCDLRPQEPPADGY